MTEQNGVERSTATEILRRLLDERGGFRVDFDREGARRTCWKIDDEQDGYCYFDEDAFGATQLTVTRVTPEQVIAATLGSCNCSNDCTDGERTNGTCRNVADDGFECSECKSWWTGPRDTKPPMLWGFKYCPNCGKRVEQ